MDDFTGGALGKFCVMQVAGWFLAAVLMRTGAHIVGLKHVTFARTMVAAMAASAGAWSCVAGLSDMQVAGTAAGLWLALLLTLVVVKQVLRTNLPRALMIWVFGAFANLVMGMLGNTAGGFQWGLAHLVR